MHSQSAIERGNINNFFLVRSQLQFDSGDLKHLFLQLAAGLPRGVGPGTYSPRFPKSRSCSMGVGSRPEAMDAGDMPGGWAPSDGFHDGDGKTRKSVGPFQVNYCLGI